MATPQRDYTQPYQPLDRDTPEYQQFAVSPLLDQLDPVVRAKADLDFAFPETADTKKQTWLGRDLPGTRPFPLDDGKRTNTQLVELLRMTGSRQNAKAFLAEANEELRHNANYLVDRMGPVIRQMTAQGNQSGNPVRIRDLTEQQLAEMALATGADPSVVELLTVGDKNPLRGYGLDLAERVRREAIRYDDTYIAGQEVAKDLPRNLFSLDNPTARAQQMRNYAYYRSMQDDRFFADLGQGLMMLIGSSIETAANVGIGAVEAATGLDTRGELALSITPAIANNKPVREEVMYVLGKAKEKHAKLVEAYRYRLKNPGNLTSDQIGLELAREFAADPEVPMIMQRLDQYKANKWIDESSRFSRIYSVFDGAVKAVPELWNFVAASQDPNGILFQMKLHSQGFDENGAPIGKTGGWFMGMYEWSKGTPRYLAMSDSEVNKEVDLLESNYRQARAGVGLGGVERLFRAVGFNDAANAAASIVNIDASNTASNVLDPVMIGTLGAGAVLKAVAKAGKVGAAVRSAEGAALLKKAEDLSFKLLNQPGWTPVKAEIDSIRTAAKVAGVTDELTDAQVIALALTDAPASPQLQQALAASRNQVGAIKGKINILLRNSDDLAQQSKAILDEAKAYAAAQKAAPPSGTPSLPAAGAAAVAGASVEKAGSALENLAGLLGAPVESGKLNPLIRRYVQVAKRVPGGAGTLSIGTGIFVGANFSGLEGVFGGVGYAIGGLVGGFALPIVAAVGSPVGRVIARNGRILKLAASEIASGQRQGTSLLLETGRRLREEGIAAKAAGKLDVAKRLLDDANIVLNAQRKGLERAMGSTLSLAWEGGVASATGAFLAYANDSNAAGAGAGIGFGAAAMVKAAGMIHKLTPGGTELNRRAGLVADTLTLMSRMDLEQRARFGLAIEDARLGAKNNGLKEAEAVERLLDNYRLLHFATGGKVTLATGAEMTAATTALRNGEINVDVIRRIASEQYPNDPQAAATYAETLLKKANEDNTARLRMASITDAKNRSVKEMNVIEAKIIAKQSALAQATNPKKQAALQSDISVLEGKKKALIEEQRRYDADLDLAAASTVDQRAIIGEADRLGLQGEERATFIKEKTIRQAMERDPSRAYEVLQQANGVTVQQIADGIYVNETGQVFIDYQVADSLVYGHEAFEALLMHDSAQAIMPELTQAMFGFAPNGQGVPGAKAPQMSRQVAMAFFDAYAANLTPAEAAKYKAELKAAVDAFDSSGGLDSSRLAPFVREGMAWWLAVIHDARPIGYGKGIETPPGMTASEARGRIPVKPGEIWKRLISDASWTDNLGSTALRQEFEAFFGPEYGVVGSRSRAIIYSLLESNGMSFVPGSNGSMRGFFRDEGTVRNPVMNEMYDRVMSMLGGEGATRRMNGMNPFDNTIPVGQRVAWARASGMDWLIGPDGVSILPPEAVANTVDSASVAIRDALASVDPANRGLQVTAAPDGTAVYTGRPTQAEVDIIAQAPGIPETMRDNLRSVLQGLVEGQSNAVLTGRYINVRTTQAGLGTEGRLVVGRDTGVVSGEKQFVPYAIVIGRSNNVPGSGKVSTPITAVRVKALDMGAVKGNRNTAFERGVLNKDGGVFKDSLGNDLDAKALRDLFPDETAFWNATKLYVDHLAAAGVLDPAAQTAVLPQGMEPSAVMLSRVGGVSLEVATRQRDAIRAILGVEARKGRVTLNPTGPDKIIRDMNQTTTDFRLDALGRLAATGEQWNINSSVITWSQFNMAPATWRPMPDNLAKAFAARDEAWYTKEVLSHPNQPYVMTRDTMDGRVRWRAFDRETGDAITVDGSNKSDALLAVRQHMAGKEWLAEATSITETVSNKADNSPEGARLRAEGKEVAEALRYDAKSLAIRSESVSRRVKEALAKADKEAAAAQAAEIAARRKGETVTARQERERVAERQTQRERNEALVADIERRSLEAERRGESAAAEVERILASDRQAQAAFAEQLRLDLEAVQAAATSTVDNAARGVVDVNAILQRANQVLGTPGRALPLVAVPSAPNRQTLTRNLLVFTKRNASGVLPNTDIAAATRNSMGQVAKAYLGSGEANANLKAAQNYILANEAGWVIHSHLMALRGGNVGRMFTLYSPTKAQVLQTESFSEALNRIYGEEFYKDAVEEIPPTPEGRMLRQEETARRMIGTPVR